MILVLIGYMGSGKSTIGKLLATKLNYEFMDLDAYIETQEHMKISELFHEKGEIYFRKKESHYLRQILERPDQKLVLALGGGTPCYSGNMDVLSKSDNVKSLYLKLGLESLLERLFSEKSHRPIIAHLDDKESLKYFIRKHLFERAPYYEQSDIVVKTDSLSKEEVVEQILFNLY